jgi:2-polyprenyl-3-methyl-5-hydroxy-6-metoxy-1,4-benzoquinol methylase
MKFKIARKCRCCGSAGSLHPYLDLTPQPLANAYHKDGEVLPEYPLVIQYCHICWHSQLSIVVNPDEMFKHYLYASGTNPALQKYSDEFAEWITGLYKRADGFKPWTLLDIACNDGTQLDSFQKLGWTTVGVDPAENLAEIARTKGHFVECEYWTQETARNFRKPFDIITAQNVFAHTDDLMEFLEACKIVMRDDSLLVIQTSQANQIINGEFDTIYHEHLSFFNTKSMLAVTMRAGLCLERVEKTDIHGTSYVFFISKSGTVLSDDGEGNVDENLEAEEAAGLYNAQTYTTFGLNAHGLVQSLEHVIREYQTAGATVIGYGAAAKGMTVLNFGKINLDAIIDDSPLKQGLLTPGMNIPIRSREWLQENWPENVIFIPLAWNFHDRIVERITEIIPEGKKAQYLKYFPQIRVT